MYYTKIFVPTLKSDAKNISCNINFLLTKSVVNTGKYQTEDLIESVRRCPCIKNGGLIFSLMTKRSRLIRGLLYGFLNNILYITNNVTQNRHFQCSFSYCYCFNNNRLFIIRLTQDLVLNLSNQLNSCDFSKFLSVDFFENKMTHETRNPYRSNTETYRPARDASKLIKIRDLTRNSFSI